jgi:O-acetyl-ADP-ribose deacetylase (regulator of RNase III)
VVAARAASGELLGLVVEAVVGAEPEGGGGGGVSLAHLRVVLE